MDILETLMASIEPDPRITEIEEDFKKLLCSTKRKGIEKLIGYMEETEFFTAPCSGGNHLCKESGLLEHSYNVVQTALKMGEVLFSAEEFKTRRASIILAAALHDLGKTGDFGKQLYVPNTLKSGKVSAAKPFKRNPDLSNIPHSTRSVKIASRFITLTEDEEWAIICHDGLYDYMRPMIIGHETPLNLLIHWADMWSSHVLESSTSAEDEE